MKKGLPENEIDDVLKRGVADFIDPEGSFRKKLQSKVLGDHKKDIVIKLGIDPTRPDIHLGHAVVLRKLRKFQDLGCRIVFIIGDFTARIGDPSGKSKTRPEIEQAEVEENVKTYLEQVGKIIKTDDTSFSWIRNSDWFMGVTDLSLPDDYKIDLNLKFEGREISAPIAPNSFLGKAVVFEKTRMQNKISETGGVWGITMNTLLWVLRHITHSRLIQRDLFEDRIKSGGELHMHEMLYPVLQGMDSHIIAKLYGSCDLEIGGTDQHFNMLMGRDVMKANGQEMQSVMTLKILTGTDGKEKMSKSLDNYIAVTDSPSQMYGKVMSIADSLMLEYFELATYTPPEDIASIEEGLRKSKLNPRDVKARLAKEIVAIYHGEKKAISAEEDFSKTFKDGMVPEDALLIESDGNKKLVDLLLEAGVVESKSEFRRLVSGGAIEVVGGEVVSDQDFIPGKESDIRIGKKRFVKIR